MQGGVRGGKTGIAMGGWNEVQGIGAYGALHHRREGGEGGVLGDDGGREGGVGDDGGGQAGQVTVGTGVRVLLRHLIKLINNNYNK